MQNRLREKERKAIAENYSEHPLYMTCRFAFLCKVAQMPVLKFAPEEIFVEAADVIDNVIIERDDIDDYMSLLWAELGNKISRWEPKAQETELNMAVSSILYAVAEAVSSVRLQEYDEIASKLLQVMKKNMSINVMEHNRILDDIAHYQDEVEQWMLVYLDEKTFLSDEIIEAIHPKRSSQNKGRDVHDSETLTDTFELNFNEKQEISNIRLQLVDRGLKTHLYISGNTSQQIILHLFQGEPIDTKIEWIKGIGELRYFFDTLLNNGYIKKSGTAGHWQMVCAHFKLMKRKKDGSVAYKALTEKQFKDGHSKQTKELDNIISLFNPNLINANSLREMWAKRTEDDGEMSKREILDSGMRYK